MNTALETPSVDWAALAPLLILIGGAVLLLTVTALTRGRATGGYAFYTVLVAVGSIVTAIPLWNEVQDPDRGPFNVVAGAVGIDGFSVFFTVVIATAVILAALLADSYLRREGLDGPELYVLMLLSASGGVIMASANDLIVTFLGLEILSIAVYVLAAMHLRRIESQEAGMKYFVLGAFSSAFFLYGIALVYGATGTTNLGRIFAFVPSSAPPGEIAVEDLVSTGPPALLLAGLALLLVGFGFKIAAVPFHSWTPDVYQGSPSPVVAFMASGVKAAGFAGLLRVFVRGFEGYSNDWQPYVYGLAVATLLVGAVLAVVQTDVKRMLAYSSINHAGWVLLGVQAASNQGIAGSLFYLAAYTFMVAGSFGVVSLVGRRGDAHHRLDDYRGLARSQPLLALAFTVFLLAQAGVPLTSGFFAKFYVLSAAVEARSYWLALIAMVSAVIAAFLYLRIIVAMYMGDADDEATEPSEATAATPTPTATGSAPTAAGTASAPKPVGVVSALAGATPASAPGQEADTGTRVPVPVPAAVALGAAVAFTIVVGFLPSPMAEVSRDATPTVTARSD